MTRRVLLTGASGFIGRQVLAPLLARDFEVHAVARRPVPEAPRTVHWHAADLLAPGAAEALISAVRPSHLLHLAWYVEHGAYWSSPENLRWVEASLALVRSFREARGARALIAGTCAEYDWTRGERCAEGSTPLVPATLYGTCKHALRQVVESYARTTGLSAAWGRIFLLYGPHESPRRLVASVVQSLLRGEPARCSSGEQLRDLLHVADVADAFVSLLDSGVTGAVNVASGDPVRLRDAVQELARRAGREDLVQLGAIPAAANDPAVLTADVTRLRDEVGWRPRFDLGTGLEDTLEWWRARMANGRQELQPR